MSTMQMAVPKSEKKVSTQILHGRVINAISAYLRTHLSVPNIFIEPKIGNLPSVDILAIDRAGSGDMHVVEVKLDSHLMATSKFFTYVDKIKTWPYHFKYLAISEASIENLQAQLPDSILRLDDLFDDSGIGRIGIISFDAETLSKHSSGGGGNHVKLVIEPERFRIQGAKQDQVEKFIKKKKPDIEVRF